MFSCLEILSSKPKRQQERKVSSRKARAGVIVYTAEWCPWCHRAMDFLKENGVAFEAA